MPFFKDRLGRRWIVVANDAAAEFYTQQSARKKLHKQFELHCDDARKKFSELMSDSAGRSFDSHGQGRHALVDRSNKRETAAVRFAAEIVQRLLAAKHQERFQAYALICAPRFLGHIRHALRGKALRPPYLEIPKDVVGHDAKKIEALLAASWER